MAYADARLTVDARREPGSEELSAERSYVSGTAGEQQRRTVLQASDHVRLSETSSSCVSGLLHLSDVASCHTSISADRKPGVQPPVVAVVAENPAVLLTSRFSSQFGFISRLTQLTWLAQRGRAASDASGPNQIQTLSAPGSDPALQTDAPGF